MDLLYFSSMALRKNSAQETQFIEKLGLFNSLGFKTKTITPLIVSNEILLPQLNFVISQLLFFISVFKICLNDRPKFICSRSAMSLHILFLSKIFRIKYVPEIHGCLREEAEMQKCSAFFRYYIIFSERLTYKMCDHIIAVTDLIKSDICKFYHISEKKVNVIGNGVNISRFKPLDKNNIRETLGIDKNAFIIGYCGSLIQWQGVDFLIEAMDRVFKRYEDCHLMIVGDGPERESLIKLAEILGMSEKIKFIGNVNYELIPKYINCFNIGVCYKKPLKSGFSPLKLYEYMACGKAIIASDVPGFELVREHNIGLLVTPESEKDLANAIIKLIENRTLIERMGENARDCAENEFSWDHVVKKYIQTFVSINNMEMV